MVFLLVGAVAAAAACGTDQEPEWETAETIPLMVCDSSETWMRPSEEEQSERVWYGPRYYGGANWDLSQLQATFYEDFVHWHGGASESLDLSLQHGLWSTKDRSAGDPSCDGGPGVFRGEVISVYLLLHEANDVRLSDSTYWITVQETLSGFQQIQFTNLLFPEDTTEEYPTIDYTVVIVDMLGRELARAQAGGAFQQRGEDGVQTTTPTPEAADVLEGWWLTPIPDVESAIERAKQASAADNAKPRFRGELGDFVIVEPGTGAGYPCPEPYQPATNPERSELYFEFPGAVIDMVGSCQGTIFGITANVGDGYSMVGRGYFLGPKLEEPFDAPADRLKLITVGGKPALAELPIPDHFLSTTQVVVIERFPSEEAPGIMAWARSVGKLERAIALAELVMGVH